MKEYRDENLSGDLQGLFDEFHQSITAYMEQHNIPGLAIAVVDRERVLWKAGFGVRDLKTGEPVTLQTVFSIQSISKSVTATATMLEIQDGRLDLDAPIIDYLPDFTVNSRFEKNPERKITLRYLLSHKAGFTHEAPVGNNYNAASQSFDAHVASISETWLKFPVGEQYSYSNLGIDLAGYILQAQSRKPFEIYMREKLFEPLGMSESFVDIPGQKPCPNCATGYSKALKSLPNYVPMAASGGVRVSVEDAARFIQFHLNYGETSQGQMLDPAYFGEMYHPASRDSTWPPETWYGLGLGLGLVADSYVLSHSGGGFGYSATMRWFPEYAIGAVVLTNSTDHPRIDHKIASDLLKRMITERLVVKVVEPSIVTVDDISSSVSVFDTVSPGQSEAADHKATPFRPEWRQYLGTYRSILGGSFELAPSSDPSPYDLKVFDENGYLYIDDGVSTEPERLIEHLPGLFFGDASGEALDFRSVEPTWRNIKLRMIQ